MIVKSTILDRALETLIENNSGIEIEVTVPMSLFELTQEVVSLYESVERLAYREDNVILILNPMESDKVFSKKYSNGMIDKSEFVKEITDYLARLVKITIPMSLFGNS